ncbi:MAG TPA: NGG1p interacting factor NIF3, partial [Coriobacteriia bacterium]
MKLRDIYDTCIKAGMEADPRPAAELQRVLFASRRAYDKLDEADRPYYDTERFTNPYADTRIAAGDPDLEVRGLITGVDMETAEVMLADRLREKGAPIDLIFAHHPEGPGFARLDEVMHMQADLWAAQGVGLGAADALISKRSSEIRRHFMPYNHYRAVQAAELMGFALMSCHTPADNSVQRFVQRFIDESAP